MRTTPARVTGYQLMVDGTLWSARETREFAPAGARVSGGGQAVFRARRDALATGTAIALQRPNVDVLIVELTTADPEEDTRGMGEFIRDDDGVYVAPWMMEARAARSPRAAELLARWRDERVLLGGGHHAP
jgi:hypothetical protein